MLFHDRREAAALLAERLAAYRAARPVLLGVPPGGMVLARALAEALEGELDVVLVRELRAAERPQLAIGAVAESGTCVHAGHPFARELPAARVEEERRGALATLRSRRAFLTPSRPALSPAGRVTILVGEGLAAEMGVQAALRAVREAGPARLVAAAAVAPAGAVEFFKGQADEVVCLAQPGYFGSLSRFFMELPEVPDEELLEALR